MKWLTDLIAFWKWLQVKPMPSTDNNPLVEVKVSDVKPTMNNAQKLYAVAKESLGTHMTMNDAVPIQTGCAEAVSKVLSEAGVPMPKYGIAGTAELLAWLKASPLFTEINQYEAGAVIVSATGSGNGKIRGHTGILGNLGIMSNESQTGLWKENWDVQSWDNYYVRYGGLSKHLFRYSG